MNELANILDIQIGKSKYNESIKRNIKWKKNCNESYINNI